MRVHKPKVEYKLALQEKPQGSILVYYYKTNNLTRINWLNTRLIIAKTKWVKYTAIWKKSIKTVKESKSCFTHPSPFSILFPSLIFSFSLLHNFIIFAPHSWIPSSTIVIFSLYFFIPTTTILIFFLNFITFPPQCYYSLLHNFIIFPPPQL